MSVWFRRAAWLATIAIAVLALPWGTLRLGEDIDSSWKWGLDRVLERFVERPASPDVAFEMPVYSYGPLGAWLHPLSGRAVEAAIARTAIHALLVGTLLLLLARRRPLDVSTDGRAASSNNVPPSWTDATLALAVTVTLAASFALVYRADRILIAAAFALAALGLQASTARPAQRAARLDRDSRFAIALALLASFAFLLRPSAGLACAVILAGFLLVVGLTGLLAKRSEEPAPRGSSADLLPSSRFPTWLFAWKPAAWALATTLAAGALSLAWLPPAVGAIPSWARDQASLLSGAGAALSLDRPDPLPIWLALAVLASFFALALHGAASVLRSTQQEVATQIDDARTAWLSWIALPVLALAFKHAYHRQDSHVLTFFALAILLALTLAVSARSGRRIARAVPLVVTLLAAACLPPVRAAARLGPAAAAASVPASPADSDAEGDADADADSETEADDETLRDLSGQEPEPRRPLVRGLARLLSGRSLGEATRSLFESIRESDSAPAWRPGSFDKAQIPPRWHARLRAASSIDIVPFRLARLAALDPAGSNWRPSPTLQLHMAYTAPLDQRVARHFRENGPELLVAEVAAIDRRSMLWETPETWRAIFAHYRVIDRRGTLLLAERREEPLRWTISDWQPVERDGSGLYTLPEAPQPAADDTALWPLLRIEFRPRLAGRIRDMAFRTEPVFVRSESEMTPAPRLSVDANRWRLIPSTAAQGLLAGIPARDARALNAIWNGRSPEALRSFRLEGDGLASFETPQVSFAWGTLR